jgi:cobalt-zinc-cadmium resistance protein CzcA
VLVTQTRGLLRDGLAFDDTLREACIGRVRPKIMTAATAILGLLPLLVLRLHGTEIERPLAIAMIGGAGDIDRVHAARLADVLSARP